MKKHKWLVVVAVCLILASAVLYTVHFFIFHDPEHIFIYLVGDIAFVPLEVLLVVIIIERLLLWREKQHLVQKLNMVIGTFFSELGIRLLGDLTDCIKNKERVREQLGVAKDWAPRDYRRALEFVRTFDYEVDLDPIDLNDVRKTLAENRSLLVGLLNNPNLLEHDRFTGLLWAIFHLMEELGARDSLDDLPDTDLEHLAGDVRRVYALLTAEWLHYCEHLQRVYPYIFSIVVRTHPLQEAPCAVVA